MRNTEKKINMKTILEFHVGRGGRFNNAGFLKCNGVVKSISDTENFKNNCYPPKYKNGNDDLKTLKAEWLNCNGNSVGLTNEDVKNGLGKIDLDGNYDTTYTTYMDNLTDEELSALVALNPWNLKDLLVESGFNQDAVEVAIYFNELEDLLKCNSEDYLSEFEVSEIEFENDNKTLEFEGKFYQKQ